MTASDESDPDYRQACNAHVSGLPGPLDKIKNWFGGQLASTVTAKFLELRHPGSLQIMARPLTEPQGAPASRLRPSEELLSGRYGWPEADFSPKNSVIGEFGTEPYLSLTAGDPAVDFCLEDEHGEPCHLAELLESKPVVLTFGMYTCPAYQISKASESLLVQSFFEQIHFLHLYTLEPHPKGSNAPDVGKPWELKYSTFPQPSTLDARKEMRQRILADHPDCQRVLLDSFDPEGLVNPIWSTYGPAPRPGFLIRKDGLIDTSQLWFSAGHMEAAIRQLIAEQG
jgi:hypothetical protein